ncbi:acyltransferase [bacterium]|nr:acyltransferase [bacterium]
METKHISNREMTSLASCLLHALYFTGYGLFKNISIPFFNYPRYWVLKLFGCKTASPYVAERVTVIFPWRIEIGERCSLNLGVLLDGTGGIQLGHGVRIAPYVCLNTADHGFQDPNTLIADQGFEVAPIVVEDDVWIGSGVQITKGVRIGKGSVIGSGAVVTKDIPPYSIAVGVPCRVVGRRGEESSSTNVAENIL